VIVMDGACGVVSTGTAVMIPRSAIVACAVMNVGVTSSVGGSVGVMIVIDGACVAITGAGVGV
jgi:hypothetical protein